MTAMADCSLSYENSCGDAGGKIPYVKNNSFNAKIECSVLMKENGKDFRTDIFQLSPGGKAVINACTQANGKSYTFSIIGEVKI